MTNSADIGGFEGAIGAEVSEAEGRKKGRGSFNEKVTSKASYACPACGAMFHGEGDVPRHLAALGDPGFRVGDPIVNVGNNKLAGKVEKIHNDHMFMMVTLVASSGAPVQTKKFRIVADTGPFKGKSFWIKRPS